MILALYKVNVAPIRDACRDKSTGRNSVFLLAFSLPCQ